MGAAGLVLATGVTMHLLRSATIDELDAACGAARNACPPSKEDLVDRGRTYTTLGNVFLGLGAAAAAAGVTLLLLDHRASPRAPSAWRDGFTVRAVASPLAFTLHGAF